MDLDILISLKKLIIAINKTKPIAALKDQLKAKTKVNAIPTNKNPEII